MYEVGGQTMRTVGIGAKTNAADDMEVLKAKLAEAAEYAKTRDMQIEELKEQIKELKGKLAEAEKDTKSSAKGK